ncbi:hypothetical protein ACMD2_09824 [Ananas comosus]|uniref:AIPP2-like SPOC-like domain-containing protein n=1 Tax=Ananas comosus TaxID=4615 RepID=A0A199W3W1_ANACO|nr:hypothetical protein ACMD2_09824 [Ananas comosus]
MEISKRKKPPAMGLNCFANQLNAFPIVSYCMQKHINVIPVEWYCERCQLSAKPVHETEVEDMNRTKTIKLINDGENQLIETRMPPHSPDINNEGRVPTKHAKVKFIPTEEVTFLTRGKLVGRRDNLSPSCLVTTPPKLKRASANMSTVPVSKSIMLSPPSPGSMNAEACISPKSASVGHAGKSRDREMQKNKSSGINLTSICEEELTEETIDDLVSEFYHQWSSFGRVGRGGVLCPNIQSRGPDRDVSDLPVTLIINPKEKFPHPALEACWMGTFEFFEVVPHIHSGIQAHFANQVSLKAYEVLKQMPKELKLEILPRLDAWPKMFQSDPPDYNDIGVYFFSRGLERPKEKYIRLLERVSARDIAMKTYIDTDIQLLIYSSKFSTGSDQQSSDLPTVIDGQIYLWGVFKNLKRQNQRKPEQTPCCSPADTSIDKCNQSITPIRVKSEEIDMDIDMVGGNDVGMVDMPIQRVGKPKPTLDTPPGFAYDGPPGFSRPISNGFAYDGPSGFSRPISNGGNKEKQLLVKFSLKNVKKPAFTEFPPGFVGIPVLKQQSDTDAWPKGENLSNNSPPSSTIGGYSGTAPKACERQPEQDQHCNYWEQAQGKTHKSMGHSRTSSPCPLIEKKRGFNSEDRLLGETKLHVPSLKLASLSAKESTKRSSDGPLFKSCGRNGAAALTRTHMSQKKQERDFKKTNHTGEGDCPKTKPMVRRVSLVSKNHGSSSSLVSAGPKPRNLRPQNRVMGSKKWDVTEEHGMRSMGSWRKWDEPSEKPSRVSTAYQSPFSSGQRAVPPSPWPTWEDHANKELTFSSLAIERFAGSPALARSIFFLSSSLFLSFSAALRFSSSIFVFLIISTTLLSLFFTKAASPRTESLYSLLAFFLSFLFSSSIALLDLRLGPAMASYSSTHAKSITPVIIKGGNLLIGAIEITDERRGGDGAGPRSEGGGEPELLGVDLGEEVAVDLVEAAAGVGEAGEGGIGEEGEEVEVGKRGGLVRFGGGGVGEEDLGAVGVVVGALLGVGEDLVGMAELLERGGGRHGGVVGGCGGGRRRRRLVGVKLESEALVGRADLLLGGVAAHAEDLVEAPLARLRHGLGPQRMTSDPSFPGSRVRV